MLSIPAGLSTTTTSRSKNAIALSGRVPVRSFGARSSTTTTAPAETRKAGSRQCWPFTVTRPCVHSSRARDQAAPVCFRTIAATVGSEGPVLFDAGRASLVRVLTEADSLLANPGLGPAKERYADEAANFEFAPLIEQRDTAFVDLPLVGVQYPAGRIAVPRLPHAAEDDHPDNRLVLQIAFTQVAQRVGIRPRRRKHGDDRADVLAVDLLHADQSGGLPRAVADGLPQPCGGRCLAPSRTAPDQNKDQEVPVGHTGECKGLKKHFNSGPSGVWRLRDEFHQDPAASS